MDILEFLGRYATPITYLAILLLLYLNRKKFEFQGVVAIYRTKIGIKAMDFWGKRAGPLVRGLGYVGIVVGFIVMAIMVGGLAYSLWMVLTVDNAPPAVVPVLPGVDIPGSPVSIPLVGGFLGLFVVLVVHEFAHGLVARAHKIPVKSTGYVQFFVIPGAFVEPDEKKLTKAKKKVQLSLFAAGAFSNMIFGVIFFFLGLGLLLAIPHVTSSLFIEDGFSFESVEANSPAANASIPAKTVFHEVDREPVRSQRELIEVLGTHQPGDEITIGDGVDPPYAITLAPHPSNHSRPYLGIYDIRTNYENKSASSPDWLPDVVIAVLRFTFEFLQLLLFLNVAIGMVNLLPLGPVDGGKMFLIATTHFFGEKTGKKIWLFVSWAIFALILVLFFQFLTTVVRELLKI